MEQLSTRPESLDASVARMAGLWEVLISQAVLFNEGVAKALGLSTVDLQTFAVISRNGGPMTPTEVATRTGLPASTTTRVLDRLEQGGYVVRSSVPHDRRKTAVEVVGAKAAEIAQHYTGKVDQLRRLNAKRTEAELAVVLSYLEELAADG
ncbi:MarR family winged helix-turn-helix transcriptional regulator [Kitasatospora sp. NPDC058965]|uniref:MarR family winged helix-turn-helix transcriptional regulator n=1 Tax=Kitasatospora sp. NPDC058965 TaxID=3346682 RepID=UPI0036B8B1CC